MPVLEVFYPPRAGFELVIPDVKLLRGQLCLGSNGCVRQLNAVLRGFYEPFQQVFLNFGELRRPFGRKKKNSVSAGSENMNMEKKSLPVFRHS